MGEASFIGAGAGAAGVGEGTAAGAGEGSFMGAGAAGAIEEGGVMNMTGIEDGEGAGAGAGVGVGTVWGCCMLGVERSLAGAREANFDWGIPWNGCCCCCCCC